LKVVEGWRFVSKSTAALGGDLMRFSQRNRSKAPALALTSMLDVIFLLLCFFVTVSVFSQWESEISIKLPNAKTAEAPERLPGEIIVNLAKDGAISVNSVGLSLEELGARLAKVAKFYPGQPVIIRADKEVRYETLVKLIDTCRASDIWNFSLATEGGEGEGAGK
jgi:biopolymer transport protein ExbD